MGSNIGSNSNPGVAFSFTPFEVGFEPDAFTAWYIAQPGLQHKAFGDFYGASRTSYNVDESGDRTSADMAFDNPNRHVSSFDTGAGAGAGADAAFGLGAMAHRELVSFALDDAPELNDDAAVGFDFEAGWSTSRANLHQDEDWIGMLAQVVIIAAVAWASAGTLGPAVAGSMRLATAATLATTGMIVSAAVVGQPPRW